MHHAVVAPVAHGDQQYPHFQVFAGHHGTIVEGAQELEDGLGEGRVVCQHAQLIEEFFQPHLLHAREGLFQRFVLRFPGLYDRYSGHGLFWKLSEWKGSVTAAADRSPVAADHFSAAPLRRASIWVIT